MHLAQEGWIATAQVRLAMTGRGLSLPSPPSLRAECSARTHSLHLFGDMVDTFWVTQIDRCDLMGGKEYSEPAIAAELANGEPLATEGLRDFPELSLETDIGLRGGDGANDLALVVFHHWKSIRHGALAGSITACGHIEVQRLVWPVEICRRLAIGRTPAGRQQSPGSA